MRSTKSVRLCLLLIERQNYDRLLRAQLYSFYTVNIDGTKKRPAILALADQHTIGESVLGIENLFSESRILGYSEYIKNEKRTDLLE